MAITKKVRPTNTHSIVNQNTPDIQGYFDVSFRSSIAPRVSKYTPCSVARRGTSGRYPVMPYTDLKNAILGPQYDLSIAYVSEEQSEQLHQDWKHADGPANILSFRLTETSGEIILHLPTVYARSADFDHTPREHLLFLLIHGMLHLAGHVHGTAMERLERQWLADFHGCL